MVIPTFRQVYEEEQAMELPRHMSIVITMVGGEQERMDWDWGSSVRGGTTMNELLYAAKKSIEQITRTIAFKRVKKRLDSATRPPEGGYHD
jgi:hypothetical protein